MTADSSASRISFMVVSFSESVIQALDDQILSDPTVGPELFRTLVARQRELGLLHRDRPTCPFLRPHIVTRSCYQSIAAAAATVADALETVATVALKDDSLLEVLGLTPLETKMARLIRATHDCVTSRLDAYLTAGNFQFLSTTPRARR